MSGEQKNNRVPAALRALAAEIKDRQAPPELEAKLIAEFRAAHSGASVRHVPVRRWTWMALAAAAIAAIAIWVPPARVQRLTPPVLPSAPKSEAVAKSNTPAPAAPAPGVAKAAARPRRKVAPARVAAAAESTVAQSSDEGAFLPLPYAPRLAPAEELDVVRVNLPRSAVMRFGLPVNPERALEPVRADLAVGRDGLVRGIRFVR